MSIPIDTSCMLCYFRKQAALARSLGDEKAVDAYMRELVQHYLNLPPDQPSPMLGPGTAALLKKHFGVEDDRFREEKRQSNEFVLARLDDLHRRIHEAPDPVAAGLRFAILGNYLDFSALGSAVSFDTLDEMLDKALEMNLDEAVEARFRSQLEAGGKLLYLTDNAGEIGFDRVFAEVLRETYPHLEILFCVRGAVCANDATREDAAVVGLDFPVIDNGNNIAGTVPELLGAAARQAMDTADVILAKGMANTETLYGCGKNVYYAFLVKCDKFMRIFNREKMTPMFIQEPQ